MAQPPPSPHKEARGKESVKKGYHHSCLGQNIFVDGRRIAAARKDELRLKLKIGKHRLTFKHTYAATVTKNIVVKSRGGKSNYAIRLKKMKPALLMINGPAQADIAVNGPAKGTVEQSRQRPIVVPLPDEKSHQKMEITLTLNGHRPKTLVEEMVAGQITSLGVTLSPKEALMKQLAVTLLLTGLIISAYPRIPGPK